MDQPNIASGSNIVLHVTAKNASDKRLKVPVGLSGLERNIFEIEALSENGDPVARIDPLPGTPMRYPDNQWASLAPNESITRDLEISDLYHFENPGKYTIMHHRYQDVLSPQEGTVCSNTISITVVPPGNPKKDVTDSTQR